MSKTANQLGKFFFIALGILGLVTISQMRTAASTESVKFVSVGSSAAPSDVLDGITFEGAYTQEDVTYLRTSLQILHAQLPAWWQYIEQAKPLTLAIDLNEGARGRLAIAECCNSQGGGTIRFGFHFGQSSDDEGQTREARQVAFNGTLTHEVTHVRDQRGGEFRAKTDRKSCVAAEKSGLDKQVAVKRAMASANMGPVYQQALDQQINSEARDLKSRELWDLYCGMFDK